LTPVIPRRRSRSPTSYEDGKLDAVVGGSQPTQETIWRGAGDGTFEVLSTVEGAGTQAVLPADLDGDGHLDLACSGGISVQLGRGDGTFRIPDHLPVFAYPTAVDAADLDSDGDLDLVVACTTSASLAVLKGHGDGQFAPLQLVPAPGTSAHEDVLALELNGDGLLDLVGACPQLLKITAYLNQESGLFAVGIDSPMGGEPHAIAGGEPRRRRPGGRRGGVVSPCCRSRAGSEAGCSDLRLPTPPAASRWTSSSEISTPTALSISWRPR
jgi:hypothetical protein